MIQIINKTKSWFFEKIKKIEKQMNERAQRQYPNEKGEIKTQSEEIQKIITSSSATGLPYQVAREIASLSDVWT